MIGVGIHVRSEEALRFLVEAVNRLRAQGDDVRCTYDYCAQGCHRVHLRFPDCHLAEAFEHQVKRRLVGRGLRSIVRDDRGAS